MQGRLSYQLRKIQSFPKKTWESEFEKAQKLSIKFIEWTLNIKILKQSFAATIRSKKLKICNQKIILRFIQ